MLKQLLFKNSQINLILNKYINTSFCTYSSYNRGNNNSYPKRNLSFKKNESNDGDYGVIDSGGRQGSRMSRSRSMKMIHGSGKGKYQNRETKRDTFDNGDGDRSYRSRPKREDNNNNNNNNNNKSNENEVEHDNRYTKFKERNKSNYILKMNNNTLKKPKEASVSVQEVKEVEEYDENIDEVKISGYRAVLSIYDKRPEDLLRIYVDHKVYEKNKVQLKDIIKYFVAERKPYHILQEDELHELEKISKSIHHEGIVVVCKPKQVTNPEIAFQKEIQRVKKLYTMKQSNSQLISENLKLHNQQVSKTSQNRPIVVILDNVENPQNIGAIARSCATFGVQTLFMYNQEGQSKSGYVNPFSPQSYRSSRGALEYVDVAQVDMKSDYIDLVKTFKEQGWEIVVTSDHKESQEHHILYSEQSSVVLGTKPLVLIFGSESVGISKGVVKLSSSSMSIPGTGLIDCLNVSQAISIFLSECWRIQGKTLAKSTKDEVSKLKESLKISPKEVTPQLLGINESDAYIEETEMNEFEEQEHDENDTMVENIKNRLYSEYEYDHRPSTKKKQPSRKGSNKRVN
ncbi:prespore-specific protein [Tieghemostelium lacteum]|uniref:rRNA methyltransferase 1, mitochondrial n=1 Tax=Tieghemostelium lacteum TaxID=361077 RepID=A0A152A7V1_TIELA|nr:prespore-specific protein [Tieghemostelium lacteum]|eukprot:KYR02312.1 prespore-specific protein [Tieghemostelium lacteum]